MTIYSINEKIYNTTNSGINLVDSNTYNVISHLPLQNVSSVYGMGDKLYVGTSTSGVYVCSISDLSNFEKYKDFPEIFNNNVRYLHGANDNLCVVSISGINIVNISTDNIVGSKSSDIYKCFYTNNDVLYYSVNIPYMDSYFYSEICTMSPPTNDWDTNTVEHKYTSNDVISKELLDNNYYTSYINDIYVTENSSKYGGNTLFLATNNGVTIIGENPSDYSDYEYRYYLLET
jgi:hypothetical protein